MSPQEATRTRTPRASGGKQTKRAPSRRPARRERIEGEQNHHLYRRYDGGIEVGYRDSASKQRWDGPFDAIGKARAHRDSVLGDKATGKHVEPSPRLKWGHVAEGLAEWTIAGIVAVANRVFRFAKRRMNWHGDNPIPLLEAGERAKTSKTKKRRIYRGQELAQTLAASTGRWRLLFTLAVVSAGRKSELLGLVWSDLDLEDVDDAAVTFAYQLDDDGNRRELDDNDGSRVELKTDDSEGLVALPRDMAVALLEHRASSAYSGDDDFVFCTRTGRPLGQRNVNRELRNAQRRARTPEGDPTFPILHEPGPVPRGAVPTFHAFRHTAASYAIADGESAEDVAWLLRHKDSTVTRQVYIHEIKTAERKAHARAKLANRYARCSIAVWKHQTAPGRDRRRTASGRTRSKRPTSCRAT